MRRGRNDNALILRRLEKMGAFRRGRMCLGRFRPDPPERSRQNGDSRLNRTPDQAEAAANNTVARIFHCQSAPFGIRGLSGFYPLSFRFPPFRLPAGLQEHMRNPAVIAFMHGARSKSAKEYS